MDPVLHAQFECIQAVVACLLRTMLEQQPGEYLLRCCHSQQAGADADKVQGRGSLVLWCSQHRDATAAASQPMPEQQCYDLHSHSALVSW